MPTYEYNCSSCGAVVEISAVMSESSDSFSCTGCQGTMNRTYSIGGVHFKGGGWGGQ